MGKIPVTQYLRPDGRKKQLLLERPREIYDRAMKLIADGYVFETEVLRTGQISLTIADNEGDCAVKLVAPVSGKIKEAFDDMLKHFNVEEVE